MDYVLKVLEKESIAIQEEDIWTCKMIGEYGLSLVKKGDGFKKENIFYLPAEDNWWGLEYGPCGPDSEMFFVKDVPDCGPDCKPGCHCGKYTEVGNDVFMQYEKHHDGHLTTLKQQNVDTGWGRERNRACLNGTSDVYHRM